MHEMGVASSVLEAVAKEMRQHPGKRASQVALRIGEFVAVDPDSLRFCFEAIVKGSDLEPLALEIEWCKAADGRRGDELEIAWLEVGDVLDEVLGVPA
jgi:Zn finger protein HypA/HybF involved in hydrogenase expression